MRYLLRQITDLQPGDHLCLIYETEAEHRAFLIPFLRQGLESGDKVIYLVDARTGETVLGYLRDDGVDADAYVQRGQLVILEVDAAYMREGVFHPGGMIQLLGSETDKALAEGYRALRASGEMFWVLRGLPGSGHLIEYEAQLNDFFPGSRCLAIFQYDRRRFTSDLLLEVMTTHPVALIGAEILADSYYLTPKDLLGPDPDSARLTNWLRNLQDRKGIEEAWQSRSIKLDERLHCLYRIADLVGTPGITLSALLQRVLDLIPPACQYPEITCASISLEGEEFKTKNFRETPWKLVSALKVEGREVGRLQVHYLEERPPAEEEPGQGEDRQLINAIAERLGRIIERKRAEEPLRVLSAYGRSLIEASLDPLVTISPEGKITDVNRATEEGTGVRREELVGRDFSDFFTEPDKAREGYQQVLSQGVVRDYPLSLSHTSGRVMEVLYNATIYKNEAGEVQGVFAAARDVTERKQAEQKAAQLAAIVQSSDDAIISKTLDGIITSWNKGAEKVYGYHESEVIGQPISILVPPGHEDDVPQILAKVKLGEHIDHYESVRRSKDGHSIDMSLTVSPIRDAEGRIVAVSTIGRDISARKRIDNIMQARLRLLEFANSHSLDEFLTATLDEIEALTGSAIGFYHFLEADQKTLSLQNWSTNTLKNMCTAAGKSSHYDVAQAGVWVDCIYERRPVIHNDYASLPNRRGMPEGHAPVVREVVVPIFRGNLIQAIIGVGNKSADYNDSDIEIVSQLGDLSWDITARKRAEEALAVEFQRFYDVLEMLPVYVVLLTPDYHVPFANRTFRERFGKSRGRRCYEYLFGRTEPCEICETYTVLETRQPHEWEWTGPDGRDYYVFDYPFTDVDGSPLILEMGIDITERKQAEEALKEIGSVKSELLDKLNEAQHVATIGSWEWNLQTNNVWWSDETYRIFGVTPQDFVPNFEANGKFIHPDDFARYCKSFEHSLQTGEPLVLDCRLVTNDGLLKHIGAKGNVIYDDSGRPIRFIGTVMDITERKLAEERLEVLSAYARSLIEASLDPLVTISPEGKITDVNRATEEATGIDRATLIGSDFSDYFTEPDKAREGYKQVFSQGFVRNYPLALRHTSGRVMEVLYNATIYKNAAGEVQGVFAAARDVTERIEAERQVRRLNLELEQRVLDRTAQLEAANKELESFSYSVSHDLRAPLRAMGGFSHILSDKYQQLLDEQGKDYLGRVIAAADRMEKLIDDILKLSRLSRAEMTRQKVDLSAAAREILAEFHQQQPDRQVKVAIADGLVAYGDPALLRVALENLLHNAWKFTGKKPMATIEFGVTEHDGARAFFVRDDGAGFDMAYADKLFVAFQRLHSTSEFPGTGIGLAIVKRIIHRHGGRVWGEGVVGHGATFYFTLP